MAGREDVNGDWYEVSARGHHGYPQPEDDYQRMTYRQLVSAMRRARPTTRPLSCSALDQSGALALPSAQLGV